MYLAVNENDDKNDENDENDDENHDHKNFEHELIQKKFVKKSSLGFVNQQNGKILKESILGSRDRRRRVDEIKAQISENSTPVDLKKYIIEIFSDFNDNKQYAAATGIIIDIKGNILYILTCAHAVRDIISNKIIDADSVYIEFNNEEIAASIFYVYPQYLPKNELCNDIALIICKIQSSFKFYHIFPLIQNYEQTEKEFNEFKDNNDRIMIYGYPLKDGDGNILDFNSFLGMKGNGKMSNDSKGMIEYDIDTTGGQSGSPIFYKNNNNNITKLIGIHTNGDYLEKKKNYGTPFTDDIIQWINSIITKKEFAVIPNDFIPMKSKHNQILKQIKLLSQQIAYISKNAKQFDLEKNDHLIIFIHGYNNDFKDIAKRVIQMDDSLGTNKIITTAFNWKSVGKLFGYKDDKKTAKKCDIYFSKFIQYIRNTKQFKKIDIVAHSMGNYILCNSISYCKKNNELKLFENCKFICIAADVGIKKYINTINIVKNINGLKWIHYWNPFDFVLLASEKIMNDEDRAGQQDIKHTFITPIKWPTLLNIHGYMDDVKFKQDMTKRIFV